MNYAFAKLLLARLYIVENCGLNLSNIIAPFIDIPMFNVNYFVMHNVQMHAGTISNILFVFRLSGS